MNNRSRPLSPHLQVYKLPITGMVSITHRMTGVMLSVGLIFFVYIVSAAADGRQAYLAMQDTMEFWLFRLVYWGFIYALFFHLCHGVRHLILDTGKSFERESLTKYALFEIYVSLGLTLAVFLFV